MAYENPFEIPNTFKQFDYLSQSKEGQDWIQSFKDYLGSQETVPAMGDRISNSLGLPQLRNQVQSLGETGEDVYSAIADLPRGVAQRTTNSLVNEGQRGRIVNAESQPLQQNLTEINRALGKLQPALTSGEEQLSERLGYELQQQQNNLLPWEKSYDLLTQQQAREFSGYTLEMEQELTRLVKNAENGLTWTNAEKDRASKLAIAELGYKNELEKIAAQGSNAIALKKAPTDLATLYKSIFG